jgi:AraC-like DNA-binding protein
MLIGRVLSAAGGLAVTEVRCTGGAPGWSAEEPVTKLGIILVRSGCFRRRVNGRVRFVDPLGAYVQRPGHVQQVAHPRGGDVCTVITPSRSTVGPLADIPVSDEPVLVSPEVDLSHRVLVARARRGGDAFEIGELATLVAGAVLEALSPYPLFSSSHDGSPPARRVDAVREALARDLDLPLDQLASLAGISTYHLSRTFRDITGLTISRYRIRLRVRRALEGLAEGNRDLARLAAESGFADQAHLTRAVRTETGSTPGRLRDVLSSQSTSEPGV